MSEIRATTISDAAGTGPVTLTKQSAAKAWVNYDNQGTASISGSQNISSCTDTDTGDFRTNFINSMSDNVYCCSGLHDGYTLTSHTNDDKTTTGESHLVFYASGTGGQRTPWDGDRNTVVYHGDLA